MRSTVENKNPRRGGPAELREMLEASGDVYIGAAAARDRTRRVIIALCGAALLGAAVWFYFALQPEYAEPSGTYPVRVSCSQCGHVEQRRVSPSVSFPLRCSKCEKSTARPLWKCRRCEREFDAVEPGRYLFCPQCRSARVGTAAEGPATENSPPPDPSIQPPP
ncbi:MAG: hypothetical protein SF069_07470 [Phycisphaerae bacterium]|nr:hypothetical protein [Phycisphaerae bacterium]